MASNSFGTIFKITTWGESHGKAIGVVIDGCPAGIALDIKDIHEALALRSPGRSSHTSPRKEKDQAEILSGLFEGKTTGAPIALLIPNQDVDSSKYESIKDLLRPGHSNYTYLEKYGIFDFRGGGRASGRETACRVAAGAVAKKMLEYFGIKMIAYIKQVGSLETNINLENLDQLAAQRNESPVFCPDIHTSQAIESLIDQTKKDGDSLGGIVEFIAYNLPAGFGDPVYEKLDAKLAYAMMSIPASKGFEIGSGFSCVSMKGSEHNDAFVKIKEKIETSKNDAGGILGGISTGMPIIGRVAFKPTSSVMKTQTTLTTSGEEASLQLPEGSRHDPCVAIRAVPVVEAMLALVLADLLLLNRCAKIDLLCN